MHTQVSNRETVLLIHGTFAAPDAIRSASLAWFEPGSAFAQRLDAELARRGSPARCWAHLSEHSPGIVTWSGDNTWVARTTGARAFAAELRRLSDAGWRCHVVAHSHGGCVLAEAITSLGENDAWDRGTYVTLSTPFINTWTSAAPVPAEQQRLKDAWLAIPAFLAAVAVLALAVPRWRAAVTGFVGALTALGWMFWAPAAAVVLAGAVYGLTRLLTFDFAGRLPPFWTATRLLALNSNHDEAWQLLNKVMALPNPLAFPAGWIDSWRYLLQRQAESARALRSQDQAAHLSRSTPIRALLYVVPLLLVLVEFLAADAVRARPALTLLPLIWLAALPAAWWLSRSAFLAEASLPVRGIRLMLSQGQSLSLNIGLLWFRRRGWDYLRRYALGLDAYPHALPAVERLPTGLSAEYVVAEDYPAEDVRKGMGSREAAISKKLDQLSSILARPEFALGDVNHLLKQIADDVNLVHAEGYTSDWSVSRIATWIARSELDLTMEEDSRMQRDLNERSAG